MPLSMICKKKKYSISRHAYYATLSAKLSVTSKLINRWTSNFGIREDKKVYMGAARCFGSTPLRTPPCRPKCPKYALPRFPPRVHKVSPRLHLIRCIPRGRPWEPSRDCGAFVNSHAARLPHLYNNHHKSRSTTYIPHYLGY